MVHDVVMKAADHTGRYLNIPMVHDSVAAVGFGRNDETVAESKVAENLIVMTDDALTVRVHVIHRDHPCDQWDHLCFRVQYERYKPDYRLIDQCHCDWLIAPETDWKYFNQSEIKFRV